MAELVGNRFGEQVVSRSVDPLLAGVYAGSSATIGLRAAAPALAAGCLLRQAVLTVGAEGLEPPTTGL